MIIENNLLGIFKTIFTERNNWKYVTDKQKEEFFFIINRFLSKKYLEKAQLFNTKPIDKVSAMNIWFEFLKEEESYPNWFWIKSTKSSNPFTNKEIKELINKFKISEQDMEFLIETQPEFLKEELNRITKIEKQK